MKAHQTSAAAFLIDFPPMSPMDAERGRTSGKSQFLFFFYPAPLSFTFLQPHLTRALIVFQLVSN